MNHQLSLQKEFNYLAQWPTWTTSVMSPMDLSCHVHYKYNCTFTLESKLSNKRLIKVSPWKKRKGRVPRLQLSMDQLKRMYSNSADRVGLSESIFGMDDRTTILICFMIISTCHSDKILSDKVSIQKAKEHICVINFWTAWQSMMLTAVCNECEAAVYYCWQAMLV